MIDLSTRDCQSPCLTIQTAAKSRELVYMPCHIVQIEVRIFADETLSRTFVFTITDIVLEGGGYAFFPDIWNEIRGSRTNSGLECSKNAPILLNKALKRLRSSGIMIHRGAESCNKATHI